MKACPTCGTPLEQTALLNPPPEPPVGTWVKDAKGGTALRHIDSDGNDGWSPPGCYALGKWKAMWAARGPLVICGPWGEDL